MRQRLIPTLTMVALLAAFPAQAADDATMCAALDRMLVAAEDQFTSISSTTASYYVNDKPFYVALQSLPGASICRISTALRQLSCDFYTGILPEAERTFALLQKQLSRCLEKHTRGPVVPIVDEHNLVRFHTDSRIVVMIENRDRFGEFVIVSIWSLLARK